jgi:hypothetical protein
MRFKQEFSGPDDTVERNGEKSGNPSSLHLPDWSSFRLSIRAAGNAGAGTGGMPLQICESHTADSHDALYYSV